MENVLFLLMFCGLPVLMLGALAWVALRTVRQRRGWERVLRDTPWEPLTPAAALGDPRITAALADLERGVGPRTRLGSVARHPAGYVVLKHAVRANSASRGQTRSADYLLIFPREVPGARGSIQRRSAIAERLVALLGLGAPIDAPGFGWALVFGPGGEGFLAPEVGERLDPLLADGERLHLGREHVALIVNLDPLRLIESAEARIREFNAALRS